eukprot:TRINITY_DN3451_c0_g2_i1.p1 TRINITY_DN3451_c0_g2~~TRINITY_DN3451_c0_g2_i1.p1  ORF type:complete len:228 (-),score=65.06 TRINITY_DN3451_c0_g2_i1:41-724(-)
MNIWILFLIVPVYLKALRLAIELAPYDLSYYPYLLHGQIEGKDAPLDVDRENWQYELGQVLRKRYIEDAKFLSEPFSREEVAINAANTPKTLSAIQAQLNGLYFPKPKSSADEFNETEEANGTESGRVYNGFNMSEASVNETVMIGDEVCPGVVAMIQKYRADNEELIQGESEKHKEFYKKVVERFNLTDTDMNDTNELETEMIKMLYERKEAVSYTHLTLPTTPYV